MEKDFPIGIFPTKMRVIIEELSRDRMFPLDYLSGAVLWVMSVLIGATSYLTTSLGKTYVNIYMMLVGIQGANKSSPLSWATEYLHRLDDAALTALDKEMIKYEEALGRGEQPTRPIARRLLIDASTPEALFKRLAENPKGTGQCADELAKAMKDLGRYAKSSDEEVYLRLFNGDTTTIDRAHQDTLHVPTPFFCLCGTIQPQTFRRIFNQDRVENGLLARFIEVVHYEEGALLWNLCDDIPSDVDIRYENFLKIMLERRDKIDVLYPLEYRLTSDAADMIQSWQNRHEIQIDTHGQEIDRATFRKIQLYVLKFALIIQILDDVEKGRENENRFVDYKSATLATILADYFYHNAKDLARSVYVRQLSDKENTVYNCLPREFTSEQGLDIARKNGMGKTCYFEMLNKIRGILIDRPMRGHYAKRYP